MHLIRQRDFIYCYYYSPIICWISSKLMATSLILLAFYSLKADILFKFQHYVTNFVMSNTEVLLVTDAVYISAVSSSSALFVISMDVLGTFFLHGRQLCSFDLSALLIAAIFQNLYLLGSSGNSPLSLHFVLLITQIRNFAAMYSMCAHNNMNGPLASNNRRNRVFPEVLYGLACILSCIPLISYSTILYYIIIFIHILILYFVCICGIQTNIEQLKYSSNEKYFHNLRSLCYNILFMIYFIINFIFHITYGDRNSEFYHHHNNNSALYLLSSNITNTLFIIIIYLINNYFMKLNLIRSEMVSEIFAKIYTSMMIIINSYTHLFFHWLLLGFRTIKT